MPPLLGSGGALPSLQLTQCSLRCAGKWALVIRSLIQPDVHSPTSAVCQVLSWYWGWDEDQTLPLFAHCGPAGALGGSG